MASLKQADHVVAGNIMFFCTMTKLGDLCYHVSEEPEQISFAVRKFHQVDGILPLPVTLCLLHVHTLTWFHL